jgi:hypothetical protein
MAGAEIYEVSIREMKEVVKACYETNTPVIARGGPGLGKTTGFTQAANELKIGCRIEEGSSLDPSDVRGVLVPNLKEKTSFYTTPAILPNKEEGPKGLLVIDELGGCMAATQKALQSLFDLRRIGVHGLMEGWLPVATGNYATDDAGAFNLLTTFQDRGVILNVKPNFNVWKEDFALPTGIHENIISYLDFKTAAFYTFNDRKTGSPKGKGFASPRTYTMASRFLKLNLAENILRPILIGLLGEGVARELMGFCEISHKLPAIEDIYRGKTNAVPEDPAALYALSGSLVAFLRGLPDDLAMNVALERLMEYTRKLPREFACLTMKDAQHLVGDKLKKCKGWVGWAKDYKDLILAL